MEIYKYYGENGQWKPLTVEFFNYYVKKNSEFQLELYAGLANPFLRTKQREIILICRVNLLYECKNAKTYTASFNFLKCQLILN